MPDFLKRGQTWLAGILKTHVSQTVTYRREPEENDAIQATFGQAEFARENSEGLTTEVRMWDFLITAADLVLAAVVVEPEPGDEIIVAGIGTFEVVSPGGEEPPWRYSDPNKIMLRIHTREIE